MTYRLPNKFVFLNFHLKPFFAILRTFLPIAREIYVELTNKADHFNPLIKLN